MFFYFFPSTDNATVVMNNERTGTHVLVSRLLLGICSIAFPAIIFLINQPEGCLIRKFMFYSKTLNSSTFIYT